MKLPIDMIGLLGSLLIVVLWGCYLKPFVKYGGYEWIDCSKVQRPVQDQILLAKIRKQNLICFLNVPIVILLAGIPLFVLNKLRVMNNYSTDYFWDRVFWWVIIPWIGCFGFSVYRLCKARKATASTPQVTPSEPSQE